MSVVPSVTRDITQQRIDAYADASGDHNRIHIDPAFAATTPFGGTIAHGMLVLAVIGEMMGDAFGTTWFETGKLKVRFKAPTRPGERVTASAAFVRETEDAGMRHLEYSVQCDDSSGETLIEGRASVGVA